MLIFSLFIYISTVADTVSFWDCGEFIAASYSMGVPHPPGAPFYLMVGRLFSLLPIASDIGHRVNLISSIVSALTVLFLYLSIVRLARAYRGPERTTEDKISIYGAGVVGALAFAFSTSFWFNAVEAEVYAMSMFFTAIVFYLALRWIDIADQPHGNALLLLIFYLFGLSSGVHLLNVLTVPALTLIIPAQCAQFHHCWDYRMYYHPGDISRDNTRLTFSYLKDFNLGGNSLNCIDFMGSILVL